MRKLKIPNIKLPKIPENSENRKIWILSIIIIILTVIMFLHSFKYNKCMELNKPLFSELSKIKDNNDTYNHLQKARILSQISLNACRQSVSNRYFEKAIDEINFAKSLNSISDTNIDSRITEEEITIYLNHNKIDETFAIFDEYFSNPKHQDVIPILLLKAEASNKISDYKNAIDSYLAIIKVSDFNDEKILKPLYYTFLSYKITNPNPIELKNTASKIFDIISYYKEFGELKIVNNKIVSLNCPHQEKFYHYFCKTLEEAIIYNDIENLENQ